MANPLCISIRTLNRPKYLKECLSSLSYNTDLTGVDFFLIQDGAVSPYSGIRYAEDEEIKASIKVIEEAKLPNKSIFIKSYNTGTPIHKELQLDYLFPRYEYAIMADDDLIFNKYYIKTLKVLFEQFKNDPKVGMLQTSFKHDGHNFQDEKIAKQLEDQVTYGFSHRWEQGFWKESAKKIKPLIRRYFDLIRNIDFNKFFRNPSSYQEIRKEMSGLFGNAIAGDHVLEICTQRAGYLGLHTKTLRHKTIGKLGGYTFRTTRFDGGHYGKINLHQIGEIERYRFR